MILVTGAAGKTGRAVIAALSKRGARVRALVHRAEQAAAVQALGARQVLAGDMRLQQVLVEALRGVRVIYHICPNLHADEVEIGQLAIAAAREAQVERFVFHSVLHPQTEEMPHHWQKLRVEEQLFKSGLSYTILQPAAYMQNLLAYADLILYQRVLALPYAPATRLGMVDLLDVAEAAAVVITEPGHDGASYELSGPEVMTQTELAGILSRELSITCKVVLVARHEWRQQARASGLGEYQIAALVKMFEYYERYGFWGNARVLAWLLDRPPTRFAEFVRRELRGRSESLHSATRE